MGVRGQREDGDDGGKAGERSDGEMRTIHPETRERRERGVLTRRDSAEGAKSGNLVLLLLHLRGGLGGRRGINVSLLVNHSEEAEQRLLPAGSRWPSRGSCQR